jgi:DNA modification methylase
MIHANWEHDYYKDCIPNFVDNLEKPRHRWYEFKEGYSDAFVIRAIQHHQDLTQLKSGVILDPFSGSGTTPLVSAQQGYESIAIEVNPFMAFIGKTKTKGFAGDTRELSDELSYLLNSGPMEAESPLEGFSTFSPSPDNAKWLFNKSVLRGFESLRKKIINEIPESNQDFFNIALFSSIMDCCNARRDGKCLRYKKSWETLGYSSIEVYRLFKSHFENIISDINSVHLDSANVVVKNEDARVALHNIPSNSVDIITFSPPYLNSFDYSDVYRPELFLGRYVSSNLDLREIRSKTLRSHVQYLWEQNSLAPSFWVEDIVNRIKVKEKFLWNKNIPSMVANYFSDMSEIFSESYRVSKHGSTMWFIVSTSAYAGIEIPVDLILADLAANCGWELEGVHALRSLRTSSQCADSEIRKVRLRESMVACRKR